MHSTISSRRAGFWVSLSWGVCWAASASAQAPAAAAPQAPAPSSADAEPNLNEAPVSANGEPTVDGGAAPAAAAPQLSPGFEAGLRLGIGLPVGNAGNDALGQERQVSDLVTWRTPIWVDVTYRVSPGASYGLYAQFGVGGTGDACTEKCDWSDLRLGAQGQWRLNPGGNVDPWLGLGLGFEWLAYESFVTQEEPETAIAFRTLTKERLGGPELLLQGGLELRVEDSLQIGPFVAASVGSYIGDDYHCEFVEVACPRGSSVEGSAVHAWLGVGLSGRYSP